MSLFEMISLAIAAGVVQGLITWGAIRVEIRYLRRDIDRAHWRLDQLPCGNTRRATDPPPPGGLCHG